jgi:hypothetical protein
MRYKIESTICENLYFTSEGIWYKDEPGFKIVKYFLFIPINNHVGKKNYMDKESAQAVCDKLNRK